MQFTKHLGFTNAPFQEEWCNYLQHKFSPLKTNTPKEKKYLLLWPRGHGKTTSMILYILWLIGNYQNIHINIVSKTATLSESILTAIMTYIESDEKYREIFGELKPRQPRKWTNQQLIIDRTEISKNPTLKATGLMGPITGGRNDLIICDDIIDEENVRTRLQVEKVSTWFNKVLYPTLYPWGGIIVIGTRWSYADIYAELLEKWPYDIKPAIQKDGSALWPNYWPVSKLEERRKEIGTIIFNCQYQNDPTGMEGSLLKAEWLQPWEQPPPHWCEYYAALDPSLGEHDYFGIATLAYDRKNNQSYLVDVWAEQLPFPDIMQNKIPLLHAQYKYVKMYMEINFWQKLLLNMPELKGMPITPIKTVRDKTQRFISMSSHFESGRVLVNPLLLRRSEFWTEWVQFPRGQHDDALDATEMVVTRTVAKKPRKPSYYLIGETR
ncbi:MAG: phage terminase large subunit [Candidatus Bathyarchaeota archaeon]|nr:phage terminase large subunit [Candidatus Bathyarchaeota archaeon]